MTITLPKKRRTYFIPQYRNKDLITRHSMSGERYIPLFMSERGLRETFLVKKIRKVKL